MLTNSFTDSTVTFGGKYYYVTTAVDFFSKESTYSDEVFAPQYEGDLTIDGMDWLSMGSQLTNGLSRKVSWNIINT